VTYLPNNIFTMKSYTFLCGGKHQHCVYIIKTGLHAYLGYASFIWDVLLGLST